MKVSLVALSVRGAMGQYLEALTCSLSGRAEVHLFVPAHYAADRGAGSEHRRQGHGARIYSFRSAPHRGLALVRMMNPRTAGQLWRRIRSVGPDVLHLFNGEGYPWGLYLAWRAYREKIPFVVTLHDPVVHPGNPWEALTARLRPFALRRASRIHIHAECFRNVLARQGIPPGVIQVIPHGSLADRFLQHRREGVFRERLALFFGRLETYKGVGVLVQAGLQLAGEIRVAIAGPGKLPPAVLRQIRSHPEIFELHDRFLTDAEVAHLFQRASVSVLPYRQGTQSSVPLIAAAFGVPVVATAVGAFPEDIPRVRGLLVQPDDPAELTTAIRMAQGRPVLYPPELEFPALVDRFLQMYRDAGTLVAMMKGDSPWRSR